MTKEQLWEQQDRTWQINNVFVTTETAWLAGRQQVIRYDADVEQAEIDLRKLLAIYRED